MSAKGDMIYAWATDATILAKGECGGAITALHKYALESGMVDAVLAVSKGVDLYDAKPVLITDPANLIHTAGTLHCGTLLLAPIIQKYLDGSFGMKISVTVKGCDAMALYELAKRNQVNLSNIVMIGVNCGGTVSPITARKMIQDIFKVDPDIIEKEEIDKGRFIIGYNGQHKGIQIDDLEQAGYGRRSNCRRCNMKVPRQADLACGNWGVIGENVGKATFIEICSEKGAILLDAAVKDGALHTADANPKGIEIRGKVEHAMIRLCHSWRKRDFEGLGTGRNRIKTILKETSRCIKCYGCIEECPICYCVECSTRKEWLVQNGEVPPGFMFHMIRYAHIADSCINCGQCEEHCAMDIPNALFMLAQQTKIEKMFSYVPGQDMTPPIHSLIDETQEVKRFKDSEGLQGI